MFSFPRRVEKTSKKSHNKQSRNWSLAQSLLTSIGISDFSSSGKSQNPFSTRTIQTNTYQMMWNQSRIIFKFWSSSHAFLLSQLSTLSKTPALNTCVCFLSLFRTSDIIKLRENDRKRRDVQNRHGKLNEFKRSGKH